MHVFREMIKITVAFPWRREKRFSSTKNVIPAKPFIRLDSNLRGDDSII